MRIVLSRDMRLMMADGVPYEVSVLSKCYGFRCSRCEAFALRLRAIQHYYNDGDPEGDHDTVCRTLCGAACPTRVLGKSAVWKLAGGGKK